MVDFPYLHALRQHEIEGIMSHIPEGAKLLDFGAGTGQQAKFLSSRGFDVIAIDLESSNYSDNRVFSIMNYDGKQIPAGNSSIDVVFSSNVLEHVENLRATFEEFRRIQAPDGFGLHIVPTASWRFWTLVSGLAASICTLITLPFELARTPTGESRSGLLLRGIRRFASGVVPRGHGTSIEGLSELWTFSRAAWLRTFRKHGFEVIEDRPMELFYTGAVLFGGRIPLARRRMLSRWMGSATHMYKIRPISRD